MTAYAVFTLKRTTDPKALALYRAKAPIVRAKHPVTPIAFDGLREVLEGGPVEGVAVLSIATMAAALAWFSSPEVQAALSQLTG